MPFHIGAEVVNLLACIWLTQWFGPWTPYSVVLHVDTLDDMILYTIVYDFEAQIMECFMGIVGTNGVSASVLCWII